MRGGQRTAIPSAVAEAMRASRSGESALLLLEVIDKLVVHKVVALAASIHGVVQASTDADVFEAAGFETGRSIC
jgi:hypothetical protein